MNDEKIIIGERQGWGDPQPFGILIADQRQHIYIIGKTGSGKTTLLRNMIVQHIALGHGVGVIDPHGDLADELLNHIPSRRADHLAYFNPGDLEFPVGLNVLANVEPDKRHLVASGVVSAFKGIWRDSWGPRLEYILYNAVAALLDCRNATLLGVSRILTDAAYRAKVVRQIKDPFIKAFWAEEYESYDERFQREAIPQSKRSWRCATSTPTGKAASCTSPSISARATTSRPANAWSRNSNTSGRKKNRESSLTQEPVILKIWPAILFDAFLLSGNAGVICLDSFLQFLPGSASLAVFGEIEQGHTLQTGFKGFFPNHINQQQEEHIMNVKAYERITERIVDLLSQGTVPWHKPWQVKTGLPRNLVTGKPYRGINVFLLMAMSYESPCWLTCRQANQLGGRIRKGEKACPVVFWKRMEIEDSETEEPKKKTMLRLYHVFNAAQCEGLKAAPTPAQNGPFESVKPAEVVAKMPEPPAIKHGMAKAFYSPADDCIAIPDRERFDGEPGYYATLFHELVHSTGHEKRLKRQSIMERNGYGSDPYCKEELIAELGSAFLCGYAGIVERTIDNSAAYIEGWLKQLQNDRTLIVSAAAQAQKAADYILGRTFAESEAANG